MDVEKETDTEVTEPAEAEKSPEERFDEDYARSSKAIFKEHSQHEIFYKVLGLVSKEDDEKQLLADIRALPEMKVTLRTPRYYLETLLVNGALTREEVSADASASADAPSATDVAQASADVAARDDTAAASEAAGASAASAPAAETSAASASVAASAPAADTSAAEASAVDASARTAASAAAPAAHVSYRWHLSPVGSQLLEDLSPLNRLGVLIAKDDQMLPIYTDILEFCKTPRKRMDIEKHLEEGKKLQGLGVFTSFFLDELEGNGGIVWEDAWVTTPEGAQTLDTIQKGDA